MTKLLNAIESMDRASQVKATAYKKEFDSAYKFLYVIVFREYVREDEYDRIESFDEDFLAEVLAKIGEDMKIEKYLKPMQEGYGNIDRVELYCAARDKYMRVYTRSVSRML